jgi:stage II sporulation SpoAA-like protein
MPTTLQHESGNVFRVHVSGVLCQAELKEVQAAVAREIHRLGTIRLLFVLEGFEGWEPGAGWNDLAFYTEHDQDIDRIAIVGDERWREESLAFAGKDVRRAAVRFFPPEERAGALAWLRRDVPGPSRS